MKKQRPIFIEYSWVDPWDGSFCAGGSCPYLKGRMLRGVYRKEILAAKKLARGWTGPRTPRLQVLVHKI